MSLVVLQTRLGAENPALIIRAKPAALVKEISWRISIEAFGVVAFCNYIFAISTHD